MSTDSPPVFYLPNFCPDPDTIFAELAEYPWQEERLTIFGKNVIAPRKIMWCAPPGYKYSYTGKTVEPMEMSQLLRDIGDLATDAVQEHLGFECEFNSVYCNYYSDGEQYIGWHKDNEPGLKVGDKQVIIASVSLGATRDFLVRRDADKKTWTFPLEHGSLAVMYGDCQDKYKHSVPKRKKVKGPRINLTYRYFYKIKSAK